MFEEPSANITQFLRDTLINDKVKFIKEFAVSDEEYNFKFEPTTTDLPEEIQYQCPILNVAIFYNAMNSFKHLVQGGSKLTGTDSWLCGPAHMAARCGRIKMLSHELLETINFQAMDWRGRTPAHYAAEFDHLDCLRFLIETKGCNPNARDKFGMTPLHLACANGHIDIIEYLIQNNAEWTTDALNRSPLEVAVEKDKSKHFVSLHQGINQQ